MSNSGTRVSGKNFAKLNVTSTLSHLGTDVIRESSGIIAPKKKVLPEIKQDNSVRELRTKKTPAQEATETYQNEPTYTNDLDIESHHEDSFEERDTSSNVHASTIPNSTDANPSSEIPPTKIPEKYHIIEQHPIRPKNDEGIAYGEAGWVRKWFPSDKPSGRREVTQLARTFERIQDLYLTPTDAMLVEIAEDNTTYSIEKEQQVYDIILHEILRQVSVECADRGKLLDVVSKRYKRLFARIPSILSELQQEIDGLVDANKSLRMLLERLMEEKSIIEHQLKDIKSKDDNLSEQNNSFSAEIQRYKKTIQHLIEEKDAAIEEAKRQQERHHYQEKLNAELLDRDEFNKSIIKKMGEQLEDAINSLHEMEAKYLASVAQNRAPKTTDNQFFLDDGKRAATKDSLGAKVVVPRETVPAQLAKPDFDGDEVSVAARPKSAPAELSARQKSTRSTVATARHSKQKAVSTPQKKKHPVTYSPSPSTPSTPHSISLPPTRSSPALSSRTRPNPVLPALTPDKKRDLQLKT